MDVVRQYYNISEILDDDTYKVATVVQRYHHKNIYHSFILADLQNASYDRLSKYHDTFDTILGLSRKMIMEASQDISFANVDCYVTYLQDILRTENISFIEWKYREPSLFDGVE